MALGCQAAQGQEQGRAECRHFFHHNDSSFLVFDKLIVYPYYTMRASSTTSGRKRAGIEIDGSEVVPCVYIKCPLFS